MLIRGSDPISMMIKAVYVDDVLQENVLALNPSEGWVDVHEMLVNPNVWDGNGNNLKMLRYTPQGQPVIKRVKGRVRIEWHSSQPKTGEHP